ncbi:MAG: N-acetyltransferase, partial [Dehalococcoidia bacterium]
PRATVPDGRLQSTGDWKPARTQICRGASIGSGATILGGIVVGERALIGAGAVVTRDVPAFTIVVGNPARVVGDTRDRERSGGTEHPHAG